MGGKMNLIPTYLSHKIKSYFLVFIFGIIAGLLVGLFSLFPGKGLWGLSYFSSETFGFWMFTTSLIVLFSEKRICGAINAGIYVFVMFALTAIFKILMRNSKGYIVTTNGYIRDPIEVLADSVFDIFIYSFPCGIICFLLGAILWSARKNTVVGKIFLVLPLLFIIIEAVSLYITVFTEHTKLFMAIVETACAVGYIIILRKPLFNKKIYKSKS